MKYRIDRSADGSWTLDDVWQRGYAVLADPLLNKGTAFTSEERAAFGLEGMLPAHVTDRVLQVERAYEHIRQKGDKPLEKYIGMASLQDRNETLFYQVLAAHIEELLPIVYTPTVGEAALSFSHLFRRGRGLWITPAHRGRIAAVLEHARNDDVRLIVVTDNERILGLGDQGAGGMVIPIGKLALYTLAAGIHPALTLPVSLDVGTDNPGLLGDDLYVGWRQPRLRGAAYDELVDEFVEAVVATFPAALLQWEDFKKGNAFKLLDRYRDRIVSFNDDIQGTAAVVVAGVLAAGRATGTPLADERFLLVGAGAAGVGIARHLRHELAQVGLSEEDVTRAVALLDSRGIVVDGRDDLDDFKRDVAWTRTMAAQVGIDAGDNLERIVERLHPTVLIGTTGQPERFTRPVIRTMARHVDRPVVMALSNPTTKCEVVPSDVVAWSRGRALIATGSPFEPVEFHDRLVPIPQCNNVYVFPGIGLGAQVSEATSITDGMFAAAAVALAGLVSDADLDRGLLYPPIADLRPITRTVAHAVAASARDEKIGLPMTDAEIEAAIDRAVWNLDYPVLAPGPTG